MEEMVISPFRTCKDPACLEGLKAPLKVDQLRISEKEISIVHWNC